MKKHFLFENFFSKRLFYIVFLILLMISKNHLYAEDFIIIANKNVPVDSLSVVEVKNIFLGNKTKWRNGNKIVFVTLRDGVAHKKFIRTFLKRNPSQFKNYCMRMLFTGKGVIPKSFPTDDTAINYISKNENVIGYISKEVNGGDNIKVISVAN